MKFDKYKFAIFTIFVIGIIVRIIAIDKMPNGLNVDEASIGYEAYSIANYGIDRNGNNWPVFLESWGSGQNALYAYIIMPFVKIIGLTVLSIRLPMAIIGCISLFVIYKIFDKQNNKKLTLIALGFFAICPWHIMKSRWGLESNIFPDLVLWASYFFIVALQEKKMWKFYIGSGILGLCAYAYGTSYLFLPIFFITLLIILYRKKEVTLKQSIISLGIVGIIAMPIILMIVINSFGLSEIHIGNVTIPKMESNRYETITILSSENILKTLIENLSASLKIVITGNDGILTNAISPYGIIYLISIPFTIIGIINIIKKKNLSNLIFGLWGIAAFILMCACDPNINRLNILWIPIIYFTIIGLDEITTVLPQTKWIFIIVYLMYFICFEYAYFNTDFTETITFCNNTENVIKYTNEIDADTIYFEYAFKEPYIYILFYNKISPYEFTNTVKYENNEKGFDRVEKFGRYVFKLPDKINNEEDAAYVMLISDESKYEIDETIWSKKYIDNFLVLIKAKEN